MIARSEIEPASSPGRPAVFLAPAGWRGSNERTPFLVRVLGLDVWGASLLNTRARREMMGAAIVLSIVFLFELTTWSVLFNVIVHGAAWAIGPRTLLAMMIGAVLATAILVFERGILIADTSNRRWLFGFALGARVGLILVSALATSQPIELLVFGHEIDERLKDEAVRAEAIHQLRELDEEKAATERSIEERAQEEARKSEAYVRLQAADADVKAKQARWSANPKLAGLRAHRGNLEARVNSFKERIKRAEASQSDEPDSAALIDLRKSLRNASRELGAVSEQIAAEEDLEKQNQTPLNDALKAQEAAKAAFNLVVEAQRTELKQKGTETKQHLEARREWIRTLQRAAPGTHVATPGQQDEWNPYLAGFVRRYAVLADLLAGRPPAWPRGKEDLRRRAVDEFGIEEVSAADTEFTLRAAIHAENFRRIYGIAFLVALFVPLLTIAFKIVVGRELRVYYSTKAQARAGNPEAIAVFLAEGTPSQSWSNLA